MNEIERPRDGELLGQFATAGVRYRRLPADEHRQREAAWRQVYGHAFVAGGRNHGSPFRTPGRHRKGAKAIHEYLNEQAAHWWLIPFLSAVPGTSVHVVSLALSAFECEGPLLELGDFINVEFFVSPPDLAWTLVRTHEDFALGGPYFVRADWIEERGTPAAP